MNNALFPTAIGTLLLSEVDGQLTECRFATAIAKTGRHVHPEQASPLLQEACRQLEAYFRGERQHFELPLAPAGTAFQQQVWATLQQIPYGETWSYQQLAERLGNRNASRAVGSANGKNPLWILIPCHRVIQASGGLGGYAGGLEAKSRLLNLEQNGIRIPVACITG